MRKLILITSAIFCLSVAAQGQNKDDQLYTAITKKDKEKVEQLLKDGANANYIKESGPWMKVSMLITAVNTESIEIVKLLLDNNAEINWKDGFQTTALIYAASKGNKDIVVLLLEKGADINAKDAQGNTVLTAAKESKNKQLIKYLEDRIKQK